MVDLRSYSEAIINVQLEFEAVGESREIGCGTH
jgi:hypothetical protein